MKSNRIVLKKFKAMVSLALVLAMVTACFTGIGSIVADAADSIVATSLGVETAEQGGTPNWMTIEDQKWFGNGRVSQSFLTVAEPATPISDRKSTVIDSPMSEEGFQNEMTAPLFNVNLGWEEMDISEQDLMFYIELPATGSGSRVRINDIGINWWEEDCWPEVGGMTFTYLEKNGTTWMQGTIVEGIREIALPDGFKGYVRLHLDSTSAWSDYEDDTIAIKYMRFFVGSFGKDVGAVTYGGTWAVSKGSDSLTASSDGGAAVSMTTNYMRATSAMKENANVGATATQMKVAADNAGWFGTASQATMMVGEAVAAVGSNKSVIINSPLAEEGFENRKTAPMFWTECNNVSLNMATEDLMFYVELPMTANGSRMQINGITVLTDKAAETGGYAWPSPNGMTYKYLEKGGTQWVTGTIPNDNVNEIALPNGFKGYIRLQLDTAGNCGAYKTDIVQVNGFQFFLGAFGKDVGAVTFGGSWVVTRTDDLYAAVDGTAPLKMNNVDGETYKLLPEARKTIAGLVGSEVTLSNRTAVEQLETVLNQLSTDEGTWNPFTIAEKSRIRSVLTKFDKYRPKLSSALWDSRENNKVMNATSVAVDSGKNASNVTYSYEAEHWGAGKTKATATVGTTAGDISNRNAVVINSPIKEGWLNQTGPTFRMDLNGASFDMAEQDVMFYVELPATGNGSSIRIPTVCADNYTRYPVTEGMKYKYLETDGKTWVERSLGVDNELTLPDGFKGYIRLQLNTAKNCADYATSTIQIQLIDFNIGSFGENIGSAVVGGIWFVSKTNRLSASVDGGSTVKLSTYNTEQDYLGVTVYSGVDFDIAKAEGYNILGYGTVVATGNKYSGEQVLTDKTPGVQNFYESGSGDNTMGLSWKTVYEKNSSLGFTEKIYFRSYVDYSNGSETVRVWNDYYTGSELGYLPYFVTTIKEMVGDADLPSVYGDVNADDGVDTTDYSQFRKYLIGAGTLANSAMADITGDGAADVVDVVRFKKFMSGKEVAVGTELNVESFITENDSLWLGYDPSTADQETILFNNPDRGFRMESQVDFGANDLEVARWNITQWDDKFEAATNNYQMGLWADTKVTQVFCYLTDYYNTETLPDKAFQHLQACFDWLNVTGKKGIFRFAYQKAGNTNSVNTAPGYTTAELVHPTQQVMLAHMKQLAPILEENKHLIHSVEAGFMGAWGEWHGYPGSSWDNDIVTGVLDNQYYDTTAIMQGIMDMVPDEIPVQVRYPAIRAKISTTDPDYKRIGFHNDAFFGYRNETTHGYPYGTMENAAYNELVQTSLTVPTGGEMFWGAQWPSGVDRVGALEAIKLFAASHQNTFSVYHNSFEGTDEVAGTGANQLWFKTNREGDMGIWIKTPITKSDIQNQGAYVSDAYFKNSSGATVSRNAFEYVRDHLGYRIQANELTINGNVSKGGAVSLKMKLMNYGFSAAFNMTGEFVILDKDNNIVSRAEAGKPSTWNNEGGLLTHVPEADIKLPGEAGTYKIAYYLHNSNNQAAYFANDIERSNGYNILHEFTIR